MASREFIERLKGLGPKQLTLLALELQEQLERLSKQASQPVAIVGMACRFPGGAVSPEHYWSNLRDGVDVITEVPPDRWDVDALYHPDPDTPGKIATRWGGFVSGVADFDADFFGITPREAANMDPQQRMVLEVAWEALERAGYAPDSLERSRTGVFVGVCSSDWFTLSAGAGTQSIEAYLASGSSASMASGRLSYLLGLQGPSLTVDTACSSSLTAIHLSCRSLRAGESSMAIAGGSHVILLPEIMISLSRARMMAADGRCKTFDSRADGYVRAEGCGLLVLKRLADAEAAGDNILAVIRGSATNQDGRSSGITAPNGPAQEAVIREALTAANLRPGDIDYLEAHGTGTSLGDPIEIQALGAVFGPDRPADQPLLVGSVKTNMGHLESAAAVAGIMKVVLSLQHNAIPPHLHMRQPSPHVDWASLPIAIPTELRAWPAQRRGLAGVSSFGFSGSNAHIILERAPALPAAKVRAAAGSESRPYVLPLAAKNEKALNELARSWARHIEAHTEQNLADYCFTAGVGRTHFRHRLAVAADDRRTLIAQLDLAAAGDSGAHVVRGSFSDAPEVAFLFSGQGSQYSGMGRELYQREPEFRRVIDECERALAGSLTRPLTSLLFESESAELEQTANLQPALYTLEVALATLWMSWGIQPTIVMGHSLGEYSAACVAGMFEPAAGARLVAARGKLMQGVRGRGKMAAVIADQATVAKAIEPFADRVSIGALNAPDQTVISGYAETVDVLVAKFAARGIDARMLEVSCAFHSTQMDEILSAFESEARAVVHQQPKIDVISNVTGDYWGAAELANPAAYWRRHLRAPVNILAGMKTLGRGGCRAFIEVGPNPVLAGMGRRCLPDNALVWLPSLRKGRGEREQIVETVMRLYAAGGRVDWAGFHSQSPRRRVDAPTYAFQRRRHWRPGPWHPAGSAPARIGDGISTTEWLYEIQWQVHPRPASTQLTTAQKWLILADAGGLADTLIERLHSQGQQCQRVAYSNDIDFTRLLAATPTRIVHMWSLDEDGAASYSSNSLEASQRKSCRSLLEVIQAAVSGGLKDIQLSVVTRGAADTGAKDTSIALAAAPTAALVRAVTVELPQLGCRAIDLGADNADVDALAAELTHPDRESAVALRSGARLVRRLARLSGALGSQGGPALESNATYLITGGLGGLGLEIARSFVNRGARHLVLMGRSAPAEGTRAQIVEMTAAGAQVHVACCDVADRSALAAWFESIAAGMPPLAGIVHAAGVLDDGVLLQQSWDRFERVFRPKLAGAWHLHELSRELPLKFFILFSSAAALLGSPGQGNYTAANGFLDGLASYRRRQGLSAVSIAWGGWAETGMAAARILKQQDRAARQGITLMEPGAALGVLHEILKSAPANVGVLEIDWSQALTQYPAGAQPSLLDLLAQGSAAAAAAALVPLGELLSAAETGTEESVIVGYVRSCLGAVLGLKPEEVDIDVPLLQLGLDSLMAIEVRNRIESGGGAAIPLGRYLDGSDVRRIARLVRDTLPAALPDDGALADLVDCMSDAEVEAHLARLQAENVPP